MHKIKLLFIVTTSKRDTNGNSYHYARVVDTGSGAEVAFYCEKGTPSRIAEQLGIPWDEVREMSRVIGKREFNRETRGFSFGFANDFIACMNDAKRALAQELLTKKD